MEAAMRLKDQAAATIQNAKGELDPKTMAIYTEANDQGDQLLTVASNVQQSNSEVLDVFAQNVG